MAMPTLIYCAGGNQRFAQIAIDAGFRYGSQLPETVYYPLHFADQDWKRPNRAAYMAGLEQHRPTMATVLDWEHIEQLSEVLDWAEEAAQYVEQVLIIPKAHGGIDKLPRRIGGADVILGYSVPTKFGGTYVPCWEFGGWPVHLLGGSPQAQMRLSHYLNVISTDGNMAQRLAIRHCQFWIAGTARYASNRWWPTVREANNGARIDAPDLPYLAFERSCANIMAAWRALYQEKTP